MPGLDGPFSVLQFQNGSADLTNLVRIGDTELDVRRRRSGASRRAPTTCAASSAPSTRCRGTSITRRTPTCSATTTT